MNPRSFIIGLIRIIVPTPLQAILATMLSVLILGWLQYPFILAALGVTGGQPAARQAADLVRTVLGWQIISNSGQIILVAAPALLAYLLGWTVYNVVINNQIGTDAASWTAWLRELSIKALMGLALVYYLAYAKLGLQIWFAWGPAVLEHGLGVMNILTSLGAVLGLAAQLYGVYMLVQLTILPWYASAVVEE